MGLRMGIPRSTKMNPTKLFIIGFFCLSIAQSSKLPRNSAKKSGERNSADSQLPLDEFCEVHFDLRQNWESNHSSILQNESNRHLCEAWNFEAAIAQDIKREDGEEDEESYYPLEIKESELENQSYPHRSFFSHIMAQYRKDLGFSACGDFFEPPSSSAEVLEFISCLTPEPEDPVKKEVLVEEKVVDPDETIEQKRLRKNREEDDLLMKRLEERWIEEKKREKLNEIIEAYSFLKYLGIVTRETTCEAFSEYYGVTSVAQFKGYYKNELEMFTELNWDYLDLTVFEHQYFPISDKIASQISHSCGLETVSPPLMTPMGIEILKRSSRYIKFHNPRTIKGRKMLLFQRLYRRYHKAMGSKADRSYIDWSHCVVTNWPENISQTDIYLWTDEDVTQLNSLLDNNIITFETALFLKKQTKTYKMLGQEDGFSTKKPIRINFAAIESEDCVLSDDENICVGNRPSKESQEAMRRVCALRAEQLKVDKADYERRHGLFQMPVKKAAAITTQPQRPTNSVSVIVVSDKPADPIKCKRVLFKALKIFRDTSGRRDAAQIDWSLVNLSLLQNHILPFSTAFEIEGDVLTLDNLIKAGCLKFINLDLAKGRAINLFQILYRKYSDAVRFAADEYFIKWKDIEVSGFPEGVGFDYNKWKSSDIKAIESCLDGLTFTAKSKSDPGIISNYSVETSKPVFAPFSELASPHFSRFLHPTPAPATKKRIIRRKSSVVVVEPPILSNEATDRKIEKSEIDSVNGFGDLTAKELYLIVPRLNGIIQEFSAARANPRINDRSKRILSEIIGALNLLLDHTNIENEVPLVSVQDIQDFIGFCLNCLHMVYADGSMDELALREFVVRSIRFRAILFGATPIPEKNRKKMSNINEAMISQTGIFMSLLRPEPNWDIAVLEHFLDSEDTPIFVAKKSKRSKRKMEE